jgi:tRNA pseudouridine38-40 synthase
MPRYKLTIEYNGSSFLGWQTQGNGLTVQEILEKAAFHFCNIPTEVVGSGRTDSGVHARGQVAHIDFLKEYPPFTIQQAINHHLHPHLISVLGVTPVPDSFHARFSAIERTYKYYIINRTAPLALRQNQAWLIFKPLNILNMQEAAKYLEGKHDFSAFRAKECQATSPERTLDELTIQNTGEDILFIVRARSFLHHQVRNLVGTLKLIGEGKLSPKDVKEILDSRDRAKAGPTAPAHGLYLEKVKYREPS